MPLDRADYRVFAEGRVRRLQSSVLMPDIMVVPPYFREDFRDQPGKLAVFSSPVPLVVEIWSASTGNYDVDTKIPTYQECGDLETWRIHPYERTLTGWVRQAAESNQETVHMGGLVARAALPGVTIDLGALFAG